MKRERRLRAGHSSSGTSSRGCCLAHEVVDEQHDPVLVVRGEAHERDDIVGLDSAGEEFVMEFALCLDGRDVDFFFVGGGGGGGEATVDGAEEDGLLAGEFAEEDG